MKTFLSIFSIWILVFANAQNKVVFVIDTMPERSKTDTVYIAGSFNSWQPEVSRFAFRNKQLVLNVPNGIIEYKFTHGGWDKVETEFDGTEKDNRTTTIISDTTIKIAINGWKDFFEKKEKMSTAGRNVYLLDTAFYMPQLKRYRRVWMYLPPGYQKDSDRRYPTIYMQDGQNLFDEATAFAGEWGIDKFLDSTNKPPCIIVAIDNGGEKRIAEYNPYNNKQFGKGEGKLYVDFLVKTLKPFIDKHFRTLKDAQHTIVAGSSMGGLISMYAAIRYPKIFGKAGVFSPSIWIAETELLTEIKKAGFKMNNNIYLYSGGQEGTGMLPAINRLEDILKQYSHAKVNIKIKKTGRHNEKEWGNQFPSFYRWICK